FPDDKKSSLRAATDDLVHHLRSQNPSMQVTSRNPRRTRVNGSQALVTRIRSDSPYGGAEVDVLVKVARPDGVFSLVSNVTESKFEGMEDTFQHMLDSLRFQ